MVQYATNKHWVDFKQEEMDHYRMSQNEQFTSFRYNTPKMISRTNSYF